MWLVPAVLLTASRSALVRRIVTTSSAVFRAIIDVCMVHYIHISHAHNQFNSIQLQDSCFTQSSELKIKGIVSCQSTHHLRFESHQPVWLGRLCRKVFPPRKCRQLKCWCVVVRRNISVFSCPENCPRVSDVVLISGRRLFHTNRPATVKLRGPNQSISQSVIIIIIIIIDLYSAIRS